MNLIEKEKSFFFQCDVTQSLWRAYYFYWPKHV